MAGGCMEETGMEKADEEKAFCVEKALDMEQMIQAAEQDEGFVGHYQLGVAYYFGNEPFQLDQDKAYTHFEIAADRGHLISAFRLALLMRTGRYGFINRIRGYWLSVHSLASAFWLILKGESSDRFWDASRWLRDQSLIKRMKKGTRFE